MNKDSKIFIAGRSGLVGSSIEKKFRLEGYSNIIGLSSDELDLKNQLEVSNYFETEKPEYVILAAAKVGGIMANISEPANFIYENLEIQNNVIHASYQHNVKKLIFLASSCIYPRMSKQPMKEEYLMTGSVEPTNEGYAIAKIAGMKMCEMYNRQYDTKFLSIIPCNIFGIGDNFDKDKSHVVAALIRKFHEAKIDGSKIVTVWGTGNARRELMLNSELADACLYLFEEYSGNEVFNIGTGKDISIKELSEVIKEVVGFKGEIQYDTTKPDGMPQKLMDVTKINDIGWKSEISLRESIQITYEWYISQQSS